MTGLYRGVVEDALLIVDRIGADLWVVQGGRAGPFAEGSAVDLGHRADNRPAKLSGGEQQPPSRMAGCSRASPRAAPLPS